MTSLPAAPSKLPATMLAIRKLKSEPGLWWQDDTPVPRIGPREVLVAVTHAGICGTDRHIYEWDAWSRSRVLVGITTGHEFVGRVVAIGDAVTRAHVGQRVSAEGHIGCGVCQPCRTGNGHICEKVDILGIDCNGCFAQYVAVPEENIWPVHPSIPDHIAAVFDPLGNAMHTVMAAGVSGRSVLITGVGIIGLMAVTIARAAGAATILVTDRDPKRLALAKQLGADVAFHSSDENWVAEARRLTHNQGPEVLLEMSGHPVAIRQGFAALRNGGTAALLGIPGEPVALDLPNDIIFKGATVLGINGRRMFETWYQVENFVLSGRLNLAPIITHQLPLANFEQGFRLMQNGEAIKVVLEVPHEEALPCQTPASTSVLATSSAG
ncbi:Alcohol dehydrogenase zinc-binding domain protein [Pirellula staleyi DSM 6068]|uniref:Alcohol dehydrogenase zinc-binding domain protein n=1 Tax=Pirellula staleyi (strain ATCC 27377 / DSM 6068 / ICPB 4128) TaxID=530564 RepID=D2R568_PIRSD|nr:L-threonine 3-dehydrogenase [Pirellula staleyi]ADB19030.1 Alcohol dehydrogenase zinc-binding domain protein [Pirellula staleyi DSM 6068]